MKVTIIFVLGILFAGMLASEASAQQARIVSSESLASAALHASAMPAAAPVAKIVPPRPLKEGEMFVSMISSDPKVAPQGFITTMPRATVGLIPVTVTTVAKTQPRATQMSSSPATRVMPK